MHKAGAVSCDWESGPLNKDDSISVSCLLQKMTDTIPYTSSFELLYMK